MGLNERLWKGQRRIFSRKKWGPTFGPHRWSGVLEVDTSKTELQSKLDEPALAKGSGSQSACLVLHTFLANDRVRCRCAVCLEEPDLSVVSAGRKIRRDSGREQKIGDISQSTDGVDVAGLNIVVGVVKQIVELRPELQIVLFR